MMITFTPYVTIVVAPNNGVAAFDDSFPKRRRHLQHLFGTGQTFFNFNRSR
jgi:hypothetical protein